MPAKISTFEQELQDFEKSQDTRQKDYQRFMTGHKETLVLAEMGVAISVKQACLVIKEQGQEERVLSKGDKQGIKRIICLCLNGSVSIAALHWMNNQGIEFLVMDEYGNALEDNADASLRRKQYTMSEEKQEELACATLQEKVLAQAEALRVHEEMFPRAKEQSELVTNMARWFDLKDHLALEAKHLHITPKERYMQKEAECANIYFEAWKNLPLKWADKRIDPYWLTFSHRTDAGRKTNKNARHPVNALLNFAYCVLADRIKKACVAQGLDTACGFLHVDSKRRASLVWDLIEPLRASMDSAVLTFISKKKLLKGDFIVEENGTVKLAPNFSKLFAAYISSSIDADSVKHVVHSYVSFLTR